MNTQSEIILADYMLPKAVTDIQCEATVRELNEKLDACICKADKADYAVSVACGILCGLADALFVGQFSLDTAASWGKDKVEQFVVKTAKAKGYKGDTLTGAVSHLEDGFELAADKATDLFGGGKHHHLRDFSHHPTPMGWIFSMLTQFTKNVYGTDTAGIFHAYPVPKEGLALIGSTTAEKIRNGTVIWFYHMVSDMAGSSSSVREGKIGTGLPGPIGSLLKEVSSLPIFRSVDEKGNKEFSVWVSKLFNGTLLGKRNAEGKVVDPLIFDLRTELGIAHELGRQSLPVLINECIVRTFYAIRRFAAECRRVRPQSFAELNLLDWNVIKPADNRTIRRMLLISETAFTGVDFADAAVRSAVESGGNFALFGVGFVTRINYVGLGRLTVSVVREVIDEGKEYELLYEKRLAVEALSRDAVEQIRAQTMRLQELLDKYMAENLQAFLSGGDSIENALRIGDANGVIAGSVTIQRVLGKKPQFTDRREFDDFMETSEALKL